MKFLSGKDSGDSIIAYPKAIAVGSRQQIAYNPASNSPTTQQAIHLQLGEQFTYNSVSGNGVNHG